MYVLFSTASAVVALVFLPPNKYKQMCGSFPAMYREKEGKNFILFDGSELDRK